MKLTAKQAQVLKRAARRAQKDRNPNVWWSMYGPGTNTTKQTVEALLQKGLVESHPEVPTGFRITGDGIKLHRSTIPVPDDITPMEVERLAVEDLKDFVLHCCDDKILFEYQVDPNVLGNVFMPLLFGALSLPDGMCPAPPSKPAEPEQPEEPDLIPKPTKGRKPTKPKRLVAIEAEIKAIRSKMDWDEADEEDLKAYLAGAADERNKLVVRWNEALARFHTSLPTDRDMDEWAQERLTQAGEYHAALEAHDRALEAYKIALEAHEEVMEDHRELRGEIAKEYLSDIGPVYQYYSKAMGTQSINGFPIFGSCRLMHREDWERAQKAITKELERRKDIQV